MRATQGISGIVLAGGQSRRMGTAKGLLDFGGRPLITRVLAVLAQLSDDLIVVTNTPGDYAAFGARLVADVFPGKGVLGGIYSGLLAAQYPYGYVVACDMPFLDVALLSRMAEMAPGCDVVIPWLGPGSQPAPGVPAKAQNMHPLHAVYSRACLSPIERALSRGDLRAVSFFGEVHLCYLSPDDIDRLNPGRMSLMNVNTPGDLARARRMLEKDVDDRVDARG